MRTNMLIRWSGPVLLSSGVSYAVGALLHPVSEGLSAVTSPAWVPSHLIYWLGVNLLLLGMIGLYGRLAGATGLLGLLGFVLAFVGTVLVASILLYVTTVLPLIASEAPAIFERASEPPVFLQAVLALGFGLGWVLLGLATARTQGFPRWSGWLLMIGVLLFVASEAGPFETELAHLLGTVGDLLFAVGLLAIGFRLWSEGRTPLVEPRSAGKANATRDIHGL